MHTSLTSDIGNVLCAIWFGLILGNRYVEISLLGKRTGLYWLLDFSLSWVELYLWIPSLKMLWRERWRTENYQVVLFFASHNCLKYYAWHFFLTQPFGIKLRISLGELHIKQYKITEQHFGKMWLLTTLCSLKGRGCCSSFHLPHRLPKQEIFMGILHSAVILCR